MGSYTNKTKLVKPDPGQCNWDWDWYRNVEINDASISQLMQGNFVVSGGNLSGSSGLNINIDETVVNINGIEFTVLAITKGLTGAVSNPEERNWFWIDSSGILQVTTFAPSGSFALIGLVDTNVSSTVRQSDLRQEGLHINERTFADDLIINPRLSSPYVINQREFDGNWAALTTGDFGYDRWRKSTGGIIQGVKEGNYIPNSNYILFGIGVTTSLKVSPASGTWEIEVADTATEIHLIKGNIILPVRKKTIDEEFSLCLHYYWRGKAPCNGIGYPVHYDTTLTTAAICIFPFPFETIPTVSVIVSPITSRSTFSDLSSTEYGISIRVLPDSATTNRVRAYNGVYDASMEI